MKIRLSLLRLLPLCCCMTIPAFAQSTPPCAPKTSIASLQQSGGCRSGGLLFSNFQYFNGGLEINPGEFVTPSNVLVTATPLASLSPRITDLAVDFRIAYTPGGADCPPASLPRSHVAPSRCGDDSSSWNPPKRSAIACPRFPLWTRSTVSTHKSSWTSQLLYTRGNPVESGRLPFFERRQVHSCTKRHRSPTSSEHDSP
jgi:hypothetical protein